VTLVKRKRAMMAKGANLKDRNRAANGDNVILFLHVSDSFREAI
jgi:hypothetical protein